jgi:AraC-like DNA-binding protein
MTKPAERKILKLSNFKKQKNISADFYIKSFADHRKEHPFVMEPHSHDFYLLMIFTKGSGTHTIDFETFDIKAGRVFFMSPGETHSWKLSDDTDGFVIFFNPAFYLMDLFPKKILDLPFFAYRSALKMGELNTAQLSQVLDICSAMQAAADHDTTFRNNILRSYLDVLLFTLADHLTGKNSSRTEHLQHIPTLIQLIDQHFRDHQPASFYASKLGISTAKLNKICKSQLDKTVGDLIQERILTEAKRLLLYSGLSIAEIAYDLNFSDNSYFSRFFRKQEGSSPEQYRRDKKVPQKD